MCYVPQIFQAAISPQPAQVSIGQQITVTCTDNLSINGGTNQTITLYCVTGGFSTTAAGQPERLPICAPATSAQNGEAIQFLR